MTHDRVLRTGAAAIALAVVLFFMLPTVLFNLLMKEFVAEGAAFCSLFTGAQNHAQKIYQRAGLRVTSHWVVLSQSLGQGERCQEAYF